MQACFPYIILQTLAPYKVQPKKEIIPDMPPQYIYLFRVFEEARKVKFPYHVNNSALTRFVSIYLSPFGF